MKNFKSIIISLVILMLIGSNSYSQSDDSAIDISKLADKENSNESKTSQDDKKVDFSLHGFVNANFSAMKKDNEPDDNINYAKIGSIIQLQLEGNAYNKAHFYSAINIEFNVLDENYRNEVSIQYYKPFLKVLEAYVDLYPTKWMSIRAGQQMLTWGEIEGVYAPTDTVCPWDYNIKTTVFEEYKMGIAAIAFNFHFLKNQKLELLWIPVFQPAKLPPDEIERKGLDFGVNAIPQIVRPEHKLKNSEYAIRISGTIASDFRYSLSFLYGFDDLPDSKVNFDIVPDDPDPSFVHYPDPMSYEIYLVYNRVMVPAIDFSYDIKDLFSLKASGAFYITEDFNGKKDELKNPTIQYLFGAESTNIGFDIYFSLYVGQMWVLNYTEKHDDNFPDNVHRPNQLRNGEMLLGYDQLYRYKWLISNVIQKNFLESDVLEVSLRYGLSIDPEFKDIDYTINFNVMYKFTNGVSTTLGFIFADKMGVIQNIGLIEIKYNF
ncbi:hypothetical protein ACFL20_07290 [Spirochaetota bacterium]